MPLGKKLRIELFAPAIVHWSNDHWKTSHDVETRDSGMGIFLVDLPDPGLKTGEQIFFTFHWHDPDRWEGQDYEVTIVEKEASGA